jgi:hypothetical protein
MDNLRIKYYKLKSIYQIINTFLIVFGCTILLFLIGVIGFVVYYSIYSHALQSWEGTYNKLSDVCSILIPVVIAFWIVMKVIAVSIKRKLLYIKWKTEIIDEI